jgi:hemoglobin-like flavoprotein
MTSRQTRLIRESIVALNRRTDLLVQLFYGRLFQIAPSVRPMFGGDVDAQAGKFNDMLSAIVSGLDDLDQQRPALLALGRRHAGYGVVPAHYDVLSTAFLWALGHMLRPDFSPDVRGAWAALIEEVSITMKAGAAELDSAGEVTSET